MKLDKLIRDSKLFERLDKLDPDTTSKSKNDGINYWKGKKIVSLAEWRKIANSSQAFQKGVEHQKTREALQYFPDDYSRWPLFPLGVQEELIQETNKWYLQYLELMKYRKNPNYGKTKCATCLLNIDEEEADGIFLGINKVIARALSSSSSSIYPCPIQNRFECPYDDNNKEEENEEAKSIHVDQLFQLSEIAYLVELAFDKAQKDTSKIQIKSRQDVYHALTDREIFDAILQQGLDEEHQKYRDKIVEFFMSIKDNVRMEDLTYYKSTYI